MKRPSHRLGSYYRRSSHHRGRDIPGEPANEDVTISANPISADGLGPAEREELKILIEGYKGFGLLSVIRALMFSNFRGFMVSLMGIALLIGQWAGPIGFIAFKLQNEDITECTRDGALWARFMMVSVSMIYFARLSLTSLSHTERRPEDFDAFNMPKWWAQYRLLDNVVTSLLYDTFIFISNLLIVFQDRSVSDMVVDVLALEFFTIIDDEFKTAVLEYDDEFLFNMVSSTPPTEMQDPQRTSGHYIDAGEGTGRGDGSRRDAVHAAAFFPIRVILYIIRAVCLIGGPLIAFLMIFYGPYCLGAPSG